MSVKYREKEADVDDYSGVYLSMDGNEWGGGWFARHYVQKGCVAKGRLKKTRGNVSDQWYTPGNMNQEPRVSHVSPGMRHCNLT